MYEEEIKKAQPETAAETKETKITKYLNKAN